MNNDVERDLTNVNERKMRNRAAKSIENMFAYDLTGTTLKGNPTIFAMYDLWNNEFDNFYRLMKYDNCINDSIILINNYTKNQWDIDPWNRYYFPTRTRSLLGFGTLLRSLIHGDYGEASKAISFVPRSPKPPIREPNMPEKRDKKDKGKEKKEKKPVIRTLDRYVKTSKNFLKINIGESTQYVSNLAMARTPTTIYNSNMSIGKRYVSSEMNKLSEDTTATSNLTNISNKTKNIFTKSDVPSDNSFVSFDKNYQAADGITKDKNETPEIIEDSELSHESEISAWKTLVEKSKPPPEKKVEQELVELQLDKVSIRPEPPIPKLDVEMVKPMSHEIRPDDDFIETITTDQKSTGTMENTRTGNASEIHKIENRKYHTVSNTGKGFNVEKDKFRVIPINRNFSKSRSPSNTDPESAQRSNPQNQQLSITKVQSDQNAFARSSARELENTDEGTSNESKRSSLSTDFQSGNRKHDDETTIVNFTQTFDAVDGERVISLNHTNQGDARLPTSVTISSRPKQEFNDNRLDNDIMNSKDCHDYPYTSMNVAAHDEYPYTCFDESYIDENKYVDSKNELDRNDDRNDSIEKQMAEVTTTTMKEDEEGKKFEMIANTNDEFVRIPGDPYPYSREHFKKWRLPRKKTFEDTILKTLQNKSDSMSDNIESHSSKILGSSGVGNLDDTKNNSIQKEKQPIREMSHDSHIHDKSYRAMLTDNVENEYRSKKLKKTRQPMKSNNRKFYVSSIDQQIVPECLRRGVNKRNIMDKIELGKLMELVSGNEKLIKDDVSRRGYHRWIRSGFR